MKWDWTCLRPIFSRDCTYTLRPKLDYRGEHRCDPILLAPLYIANGWCHFHFDGVVNTYSCMTLAQEIPLCVRKTLLHIKDTVWSGFTASFIIEPFNFEELFQTEDITFSVIYILYASLLRIFLASDIQQRDILGCKIFITTRHPSYWYMCETVSYFSLNF